VVAKTKKREKYKQPNKQTNSRQCTPDKYCTITAYCGIGRIHCPNYCIVYFYLIMFRWVVCCFYIAAIWRI